jgi:hypothetical protein
VINRLRIRRHAIPYHFIGKHVYHHGRLGLFRPEMLCCCSRPAVMLPAARRLLGDLLRGQTPSSLQQQPQPPSPVQQQQMQRLARLAADAAQPRLAAEASETLDDGRAHGAQHIAPMHACCWRLGCWLGRAARNSSSSARN